jgi:4a-hydroxytetrahydrobiopterin dehydratase
MKHFIKEGDMLRAEFVFVDFAEAFSFMTRVAFEAERLQHHPNWENVWNRVGISLTTHDAGNKVTEKDEVLAAAIEEIFERSSR